MNSKEYYEFISKFEERHTTDDCYTPPAVYDVVSDWVAKEYNLNPDNFVRPFVPNGDYQAFEYAPDAVVVDNPPFSILSKIIDFYTKNKVKFFVFAPGLTAFSSAFARACVVGVGYQIRYDNGARVNTSFITNLDECAARTAPELYSRLRDVQKPPRASVKPVKNIYPREVLTSSMLNKLSSIGIDFAVKRNCAEPIRALDAQREKHKGIFGAGLLLSEKAAAEKAATTVWKLSDREREIIAGLGG